MNQVNSKTDVQKSQYRYDAFLSYAHEDKPTVEWLHSLLTKFWVPWKRRRRIFLDQESLPAGGGLSTKLQNALRESRFLIVCCSKDSADSYRVDIEINEFLKSHPPDNVLACLVGQRSDGPFAVPLAVQSIEKQLADELLKPDLRAHSGSLKGRDLKVAIKEALSLLAPLVDLPSKDSLLDQRKKNLIVGSVLMVVLMLSAYGWKLWDDRAESQVNKAFSRSSELVRATAADSHDWTDEFGDVEGWLRTLVISGRINEALEAARKIEYVSDRSKAMISVVRALMNVGKVDEAQRAARGIEEALDRAVVMGQVVDCWPHHLWHARLVRAARAV